MIQRMLNIAAICSRIPRRVRVDITSIGVLDLTHGGTATADATTDGTTLTSHSRKDEGGDESSPTEPEEGSRGLSLAAVLLKARRAVGDTVVESVILRFCQALYNKASRKNDVPCLSSCEHPGRREARQQRRNRTERSIHQRPYRRSELRTCR